MAGACAMSSDRVLPPPYSLTQIVERLPAHARRKYEDIKALLADAEALQRSLMERMKAAEDKFAHISRQRSYSNDVELDGELEAARAALERLDKERSRRNSIRGNTEQVKSRLDNWLLQRASGAVDIAAPPKLGSVPAGRRKGESLVDALGRVRREIAAARAELQQTKSAPPTPDEIKIAIIEEVNALAEQGCPQLTSEGGKVELHWPDQQLYGTPGSALSAPAGSASKLLAWLFRKRDAQEADRRGRGQRGWRPERRASAAHSRDRGAHLRA